MTDEVLLARCRDGAAPEDRFRPHRLPRPGADLLVFFRDREISDRVGFRYAALEPAAAVEDFLAYAMAVHESAAQDGPDPSVLVVALDGENPWQTYADAGEAFLTALYSAVAGQADLAFATPSELLAGLDVRSLATLDRLAAGSWVDGDLTTWAGQPAQNEAWDALEAARHDLAASASSAATAWHSLWAAEGSDWFWWFGTGHTSPEDTAFRATFLVHLRNTYLARGAPAPPALTAALAEADASSAPPP
jgi:alpha-amylase/alpha-mannosidase (GH57 family)